MTDAKGDGKVASTTTGPPTGVLPAALALAAGAGGVALVRGGEPSGVAGGVLLLVAALALAAVAIGGAAEDPEAGGGPDLGSRLGLGLLGGFLGAVAALAAQGTLAALGLTGWLGVELPGLAETGGAVVRLLQGALWGLLFGVVLPWVPGGGGTLGRGAAFSLLPSLTVLLVAFPADPTSGWLGLERGALAPAFVLLLNGVWGIATAAVMAWGERSGKSLSSPLGA